MTRYRYPGVRPFGKDDKHLFFGREDDIQNLFNMVTLERNVVLFGKSGLGKTSLINAGILGLLEEAKITFSVIRFGNRPKERADTIHNIFLQRTRFDKTPQTFLSKIATEDNSYWRLFKERQINAKLTRPHLLIFDQFEELFTYPEQEIETFASNLAELLSPNVPDRYRDEFRLRFQENTDFLTDTQIDQMLEPLNVKILISIRSDRLSFLNRLTGKIPNILQRCYELQPLTFDQAKRAIINPARLTGAFDSSRINFSPELLDSLIKSLSSGRKNFIESFQLQLICRFYEEKAIQLRITNKAFETTFDLEKGMQGEHAFEIQNINLNFYINVISSFPNEVQRKIRVFIEEGLIFEEESRRISVDRGQIISKYNIDENLLGQLINKHIIRSENYGGNLHFEISHDTLVEPVLKAKQARIAREETDKALAELEKKRQLDEKINTLRKAKELSDLDDKTLRLMKKQLGKKQASIYESLMKSKDRKTLIRRGSLILLTLGAFLGFLIWGGILFVKNNSKNRKIRANSEIVQKANARFKQVIDGMDSLSGENIRQLESIYAEYEKLENQ